MSLWKPFSFKPLHLLYFYFTILYFILSLSHNVCLLSFGKCIFSYTIHLATVSPAFVLPIFLLSPLFPYPVTGSPYLPASVSLQKRSDDLTVPPPNTTKQNTITERQSPLTEAGQGIPKRAKRFPRAGKNIHTPAVRSDTKTPNIAYTKDL